MQMKTYIRDFCLWLRHNLFFSFRNGILSVAAAVFLFWIISSLVNWFFLDAVWFGTIEDCRLHQDGACWPFVGVRFSQFLYGFYPSAERWRVNLVLGIFFGAIGLLVYERMPYRSKIVIFMLCVFPLFAWFLLRGGVLWLADVPTGRWGGFMLTLVLASVSIVASLPLGILLALGRRANTLPFVKAFCVVFIEFWRGVPLITVLFATAFMLPLFMPASVNFDQLLRAMVGFILFSSAYMAEVVRGGLEGLDRGQYEASDALGMSYWQSRKRVILPQALKIMIPGILLTIIGLFKDTTLVLIIGLLDFLGMIQAGIADPRWGSPNVPFTGYAFAALVYFCFCYSMSVYARYIEKKYSEGRERR